MRPLDKKLMRDSWRLRAQILAIGAVVACGLAANITMNSAHASLVQARNAYYDRYRLGHVWANAERVPLTMAEKLANIPGVASIEVRLSEPAMVDVEGFDEPISGRVISLPGEGRHPGLADLHLREGRWLSPEGRDEILISEAFALAHQLHPGATLRAIFGGRAHALQIVGVVLSPEHVFSSSPGAIWPDDLRWAVMWMAYDALAPALDRNGAFNDVALQLAPGAQEAAVIEAVDTLLEPYGSPGAYGRSLHPSDRFVRDELQQLRLQALIIPAIFLGVAAFLLNVILGRLIGGQREEIASLKALGYSDLEVGLHFLKFVMLIVAVGAVLGVSSGAWLGRGMLGLYRDYFRFPVMPFVLDVGVLVQAAVISAAGGLVGGWSAVRGVVRLSPAEAMRPPAPARFGQGVLDRGGLLRKRTPGTRMVLRNLQRRPLHTALSVLSIAFSVAVLLPTLLLYGSVFDLLEMGFFEAQKQSALVTFTHALPQADARGLASTPGVLWAEPVRYVPVRFRNGHRSYETELQGLRPDTTLRKLVNVHREVTPLPTSGLVLTRALGTHLDVSAGETLVVEVLEGERPVRTLAVAGLVEEAFGMSAYMELGEVNRLLREGPLASAALLLIDPARETEVYRELKDIPAVAGVNLRAVAHRIFRESTAQTQLTAILILVLFACTIAVGVVYNAARILLAERSRELASLRVLGFTVAEISRIWLGELMAVVVVALPVGVLLGHFVAAAMVAAISTELYRFPMVPKVDVYVVSALIVFAASAVTALLVMRRLRGLDLVGVLKTRE